ncbi:MAG TPA: RES family NAD+ phosphorylase [Legionellaceae bacterium]|nr:RES family NAD+ phosphorylase [Legionellaceae bacterium]
MSVYEDSNTKLTKQFDSGIAFGKKSNLWQICNGEQHIIAIEAEPWRMVEAQHISSSRDLVDTLEEHDLLVVLLENTKPWVDKSKDYLIFTPFRYPPLQYGSRFGHRYEPSLWYGSLALPTAMAEVAYYRLQFFQDTEGDLEYIEIPMTAFQAFLQTSKGIDLTQAPFDAHQKAISNPHLYQDSQTLGSAMREAGIEACLYFSARTVELSKNIAVYTPNVFKKKKEGYIWNQQNWMCMANKHRIEFTRLSIVQKERISFSMDDYPKA